MLLLNSDYGIFETGLLLSQSLSFKAYKIYITTTHLVSKLYKNKHLRH